MNQTLDPLARSTDPRILATQEKLGHGLLSGQDLRVLSNELSLSESFLVATPMMTERLKQTICRNLVDVLNQWGLEQTDKLENQLLDCLNANSRRDLASLIKRVLEPAPDWGFRPGDPVVMGMMNPLMDALVLPDSRIENTHMLDRIKGHPVIFLGNHLSAVDVHVLQHLLRKDGQAEIAEKMTAVVGYKTFELPLLRQLSLAFGTLKVPQSASIHTGHIDMKVQDVARFARQVINAAEDRLQQGDHLVVFPEGTRSRTGQMLPCLSAISRYLNNPELMVVPFAHHGTERILPVDNLKLNPSSVTVTIGTPVLMSGLLEESRHQSGNRSAFIMDYIGQSIARLLPERYQGHYRVEARPAKPVAANND